MVLFVQKSEQEAGPFTGYEIRSNYCVNEISILPRTADHGGPGQSSDPGAPPPPDSPRWQSRSKLQILVFITRRNPATIPLTRNATALGTRGGVSSSANTRPCEPAEEWPPASKKASTQ